MPKPDLSEGLSPEDIVRFWERVGSTQPNGCRLWLLKPRSDGYGQFSVGAWPFGAHRIAFLLANDGLDPNLDVLHRCDTPMCVEATHLWQGTPAENNADKKAKGRETNGRRERTHCSEGHPFDEINTRIRTCGRRACRTCDGWRSSPYADLS